MTPATTGQHPTPIVYPDQDGKRMSDNTKQFQWIQTIEGNLEILFRERADVFVAGDNLWYPVEGHPAIRTAPDVYVAFGRPKGHRGSYMQWVEGGVPLTVVFEILSPGNTRREMDEKLTFYDEHGAEEYYLYDPDRDKLKVYLRGQMALARVRVGNAYVSPRLGIRFDLSGTEMVVRYPDGEPFLTFEQLGVARMKDRQRADEAQRRAAGLARLAQRLALGQATPEEVAELQRLAAQTLAPPD